MVPPEKPTKSNGPGFLEDTQLQVSELVSRSMGGIGLAMLLAIYEVD